MDAMDDRVVIALFRHGVTEANEKHAYLGWTDSPLYPMESIHSLRYEQFFSSDLPRCMETLRILFPTARPVVLKELREMNFGKWEGKTYEELKEIQEYQDWLANPFEKTPLEGESFEEFSKRIQAGWDRIVADCSGCNRIAVMTHGGVIRYLLSQYAPVQKEFWDWQVGHASGYELEFEIDALRRGERCTLLREVPLTEKRHG
ncbi:histidine phosphatase family protein [Ferdinandcohnia quinoae]|uniref:Histidine phosphatase family protein n=1 Tax=Fredinandcohnia quinoae TaxID=2918902 RepID=A0AAW5EAH0_9BACI|nr:histidine phosphatase family protein [Fredinandcohnia sp. SECRCQ15]MCH1626411.1 histidine phosphatase family protein [Fredinandcohnia sp. SECRCQ15]